MVKRICIYIIGTSLLLLFLSPPIFAAERKTDKKNLLELIKNGDIEGAYQVIGSSRDYNLLRDEDQRTPLHLAVLQKEIRLIESLLNKGADPNLIDIYGLSSLHLAVIHGNPKIVGLLVNRGADVSLLSVMQESPLSLAFDRKNEEMLKVMINPGNVDSLVKSGESDQLEPIIIRTIKEGLFSLGKIHLVEKLRANPNLPDSKGDLAIDWALRSGDNVESIALAAVLLNSRSKRPKDSKYNYFYEMGLKGNWNRRFAYGKSGLHLAVEKEQLGVVKFLLAENLIEANVQDELGNTPLHLNAEIGNYEIMVSLVEGGADVNKRNKVGESSLYASIKRGNKLNYIQTLWGSSEKKNEVTISGDTLIHAAVEGVCDLETFDYLLGEGINYDRRNMAGKSPLMVAVDKNKEQKALKLIEYKANQFASDGEGLTPVLMALRDYKKAKWFFGGENNSAVNRTDTQGATPLHIALRDENVSSSVVFLLLDAGADVNQPDSKGDTPLMESIREERLWFQQALLRRDLEAFKRGIFLRNNKNETPLTEAMRKGPEFYERFLPLAYRKIQDDYGRSPIFYAVKDGVPEIVKLLVEGNPEVVNERDNNGETPLFGAIRTENSEITKYLIGAGANPLISDNSGENALFEVLGIDHYREFSDYLLIKQNSLINTADRDGMTLLHHAVRKGDYNMTLHFLKRGAMINAADKKNRTPLYYAVYSNVEKIAGLLLRNGAEVNARDIGGDTLLHLAVLSKAYKTGKILIQYRANIFAQNREGDTPFDLLFKDSEASYEWALSTRNVVMADDKGNTLLHIAVLNHAGKEVILSILDKDRNVRDITNITGDTAYDLARRMGGFPPFVLAKLNPEMQ